MPDRAWSFGHEPLVHVSLDGEGILHWRTSRAGDPECAQSAESFRGYGPPEVPAYLNAPAEVLDELCEAVGAGDPPWRKAPAPEFVAFLEAAREQNIERMGELLRGGLDINTRDHQGRTALWAAAENPNTPSTRWLLEHGADVNVQDRYGRTALMEAVARNREDLADLYREFGADRNLRDQAGRTAWLIGIETQASTLLISSVCPGREDWPRAMHLACWVGNHDWIEGEEWYVESARPDLNQRDGRPRWTPLQACLARTCDPRITRFLAAYGADLTVVDTETKSTLAHYAVKRNWPWLVEACVRAGVRLDARDAEGGTAWTQALDGNERPRLVRALLEASVDYRKHVDSVVGKAASYNLVWAHWLMTREAPGKTAQSWTGLCCYAALSPVGVEIPGELDPANGTIWLEYPAEWWVQPRAELDAKIMRILAEIPDLRGMNWALPVHLSQGEAYRQPAAMPDRRLWALFPDETAAEVKRLRYERPREMIADPATFAPSGLQQARREWKWKARTYRAEFQEFRLRLRRGQLTWEGDNCRSEQSIARFKVEGPPRGSHMHRVIPPDILDELCTLIGDYERTWERPWTRRQRQERVEAWVAAQEKPAAPLAVPPPPPHQSGKFCYARMDIEDHFTTPNGAGSDGEWSCWMEFPAEWCACLPRYLEAWLVAALERAYAEISRKASGPDGGHYSLNRCFVEVLSLTEAVRQPWRERGKVLYTGFDEREQTPLPSDDEARHRPLALMGNPENPPTPIPISPPPLR